ncbi:hypothetical protein RR48_01330 [Papilio machaon]|uniref:Uncharacterized protein n=1 Tax=Papilio machaon TaxID=76193 RepID=A0A0N1IGV9_PAPMA|nr:hypothetical protein RR48_01330 [Papilio machaon]
MVHRASTINNENTVHSFNTFGANEVQQIIATSAQRPPESNFRHQDKGSTVWTGEDKTGERVRTSRKWWCARSAARGRSSGSCVRQREQKSRPSGDSVSASAGLPPMPTTNMIW